MLRMRRRDWSSLAPRMPEDLSSREMAALSLVTLRKNSSTSLLMVSKLTLERLLQADWKLWF